MRCGTARRLFSAYWDDEVSQAEREGLERHFASCGGCRAAYEELARVLEAMASLPRLEAAPDLEQRVWAAARRSRPARDVLPEERPRWALALGAAAALALAMLAGYQMGSAPRTGRTQLVTDRPPAATPAPPSPTTGAAGAGAQAAAPGGAPLAEASLDSLFDHSADVEFILDPVVLYKGRPRPVSGILPAEASGEKVMITF